MKYIIHEIKCTIASLLQNRITRITRWSKVEEAVRFLSTPWLEITDAYHKYISIRCTLSLSQSLQ